MRIFNQKMYTDDIINYRSGNNLTQENLAAKLNINRATLSNLETGKKIPSLDELIATCDLLRKSLEDYYYEKNTDPLVYMMAKLELEDSENLEKTFNCIMLYEKYHALNKRCTK